MLCPCEVDADIAVAEYRMSVGCIQQAALFEENEAWLRIVISGLLDRMKLFVVLLYQPSWENFRIWRTLDVVDYDLMLDEFLPGIS